ncbi:hypothetical protein [Phaeobacter piscinae]|uniref:DsbA family protein n=1 Tax=Phaeobacter piscinae TaxID=1580596 RepID=UPI00058E4D61|nr:hypothetical protein [Phaeobacter piscinae]UTS82800.1 hypothetical protein OL67_003910 [Phaeobacter piscinae]
MASETIAPAETGHFRTFAIALSVISVAAVTGLTVVSVSALRSPAGEPTFQLVQGASVPQVAQGQQPRIVQEPYVPATQQSQQAAIPTAPTVTGPSVEEMVRAAQAAAIAANPNAGASGAAPELQSVVQAQPTGPTLSDLLAHPESGPQIVDSLKLAAGIEAPGEIDNGTPIFAFFDPRCPYCHAAYEDLNGKYRIKWLPTLALGVTPEGEATIATLLGVTEAAMDGGRMMAASLSDDDQRLERLNTVLSGGRLDGGEITEAQRFVINDNLQIALQLYEYHNEPFGVPTFIIPKPDGTAVLARGWDARSTLETISSAYGTGS